MDLSLFFLIAGVAVDVAIGLPVDISLTHGQFNSLDGCSQ